MIRRYAELRPEELAAALEDNPLAICPWGALEWHGPHLPLGTDGLIAEPFCERLAEATGGILLPCMWLTQTGSIAFPPETVCAAMRTLLDGLAVAGAKTVCLVTGHYSPEHELAMYRECREAMLRNEGFRVIAASPLELMLAEEFLDHGGLRETSQMLALRPDLVGAEGQAGEATAEYGEKLLSDGVESWRSALALWSLEVVFYFYMRRERQIKASLNAPAESPATQSAPPHSA